MFFAFRTSVRLFLFVPFVFHLSIEVVLKVAFSSSILQLRFKNFSKKDMAAFFNASFFFILFFSIMIRNFDCFRQPFDNFAIMSMKKSTVKLSMADTITNDNQKKGSLKKSDRGSSAGQIKAKSSLQNPHSQSHLQIQPLSPAIIQTNMNNLSNSTSTTKIRRAHTNKYSKFAEENNDDNNGINNKKQKQNEWGDPLELAKKRVDQERIQEEITQKMSLPSRGTTVPTLLASESLPPSSKILSGIPLYDNVTGVVPSDPFTFGYVNIGTCLGPHGVKGEMKVQLETDFAETYLKPGAIIFIKKPNRRSPRPIKIKSSRQQVGETFLLFFEGINSRLSAVALKGYKMFVRKTDRPLLKPNEYLIRDLVGVDCYCKTDKNKTKFSAKVNDDDNNIDDWNEMQCIGKIEGIVPPDELCGSGAIAKLMHAMLEMRKIGSQDLCLIPLVPQIVLRIDIENKRCEIDPPEGLLSLTYTEKKKVVIRGFLPAKSIVLSDAQRKILLKSSLCVFVEK